MSWTDNEYISGSGILYRGAIQGVPKSQRVLVPVFEAFTNALEAIRDRNDKPDNGSIRIVIRCSEELDGSPQFVSLTIEDNGIGFNDIQFQRFLTYKDFRKGYKNRGSGRIQLIHHFDQTEYSSVYKDNEKYFRRLFSISKNDIYLDKNAITLHKSTVAIAPTQLGTSITMRVLLDPRSKTYHELTAKKLKEELLKRYMHYFCHHKDILPTINIDYYRWEELCESETIQVGDVPGVDKTDSFELEYHAVSGDGRTLTKTADKEKFTLDAYRIDKERLGQNQLRLASKGEIIDTVELDLGILGKDDTIHGSRFLFVVSSNYIDDQDSDDRGSLKIPTRKDYSSNIDLFGEKVIFLNDIEETVRERAQALYPEFGVVIQEHADRLEKLKKMFLLNDGMLKEFSLSVNDTEEKILQKFYVAEAKHAAEQDAKVKAQIDRLDSLNTGSETYNEDLNSIVADLVKEIPVQSRTDLTHYVARRKLVLQLFDKILKRHLAIQAKGKRNDDEKLIHNLLFQQGSQDPAASDLWLLNEDFIYFDGVSEEKLKDIQWSGKHIMKQVLTDEEQKYLNSLNEKRYEKRPDVLLFPKEGKCILVEFKNPNVSVSDHLHQINEYASLILNLSDDSYRFNTFYGYLVGEAIDFDDVQNKNSDFQPAYHFDYLFRPYYRVRGNFGRQDGSLYSEILRYSTVLERASKRNEAFIEKLKQNYSS